MVTPDPAHTGDIAAVGYSAAFDTLSIGSFRIDESGFVVDANAAAQKVLGLNDDTPWPGRHFSQVPVFLQSDLKNEIGLLINQHDLIWKRMIELRPRPGRIVNAQLCLWSAAVNGSPSRGLNGLILPSIHTNSTAPFEHCESQHVQILEEVSTALTSSLEISQILRVILTGATAGQGLGFNRAFLLLADPEVTHLKGNMAVGPSSPEEAGRIWHGLSVHQRSLREILEASASNPYAENQALTAMIKNISIDLNSDCLIAQCCRRAHWCDLGKAGALDDQTYALLDQMGTREVVMIPMISRGRLQGLLLADNRITGHPISEHDIHLLQSLSGQASVAMERARLYEAQRRRAEELEETNRKLAESQDRLVTFEKMSIIGELTSAVAHELRNPLAIVGGFANLMLRNTNVDDQREYLTIISNEVKHMEVVLDHVLDFSRASKVESSNFEFSAMVEQTLELAQRRLRRPDIKVDISKPDHALNMVGNYDQLSHAVFQIFTLISNDISTGGNVSARIEHVNDTARLQIRLNCADEHHDMVRTALEKTFAKNPATHRLPLMVAAETLKYHGGSYELTADSSHAIPCVTIELPLRKV